MKEGDSGTTDLLLTVTLSAPAGENCTVEFATADGTARPLDGDFDTVNGTFVFTAGDSVLAIHVPVHGDVTFEGNEWFTVQLSNPTGLTLDDSVAVGTIVNDERTTFGHYLL